jgi:5-methylcytosine-specific restriction endonuclease McrA
VYRRLGLGSVCSPECEATVRSRQRGGRAATKLSDRRDSYFIEPAPGAGDNSTGNTPAAPGAGDFRGTAFAASGDTDDIKIRDESHQRDGTHDCLPFGSDHDSKKTLREESLATTGKAPSRDWKETVLERDQRCRYCGTRRNLHVHHIDYKSQGGNNDLHNLIALCVEHHDLVHSDKGLWQPTLRAYIWLLYIEGRRLFLLDIRRIYGRAQ